MKKTILMSIFLCSLTLASNAWSLTVGAGNINVGGIDPLHAQTTLADSGEDTEIGWVQGLLGSDYTFVKNNSPGEWQQVNEGGAFALELLGAPDYFLIKIGTGQTGLDSHYLFANSPELDWAVIAGLFSDSDVIERISHIDEFGGAPVPEPGTIMLLGAGFFGLAIYGKRRRNS